MQELKDRYIDPFTDFGFKKLFGEESNKELLLNFLNELLYREEGKIVSLSYLKTERLGVSENSRKAIFDLYYENEKGEKFIVELQKTKQGFFKDRTLYYSTFPIANYVDSLNSYRDLKNSLDYAKAEGKVEGKAEGRAEGEILKTMEIAKNAKALGLSIEQIQKLTNLTK